MINSPHYGMSFYIFDITLSEISPHDGITIMGLQDFLAHTKNLFTIPTNTSLALSLVNGPICMKNVNVSEISHMEPFTGFTFNQCFTVDTFLRKKDAPFRT